MRTATMIEASDGASWQKTLDFVLEAEKIGLDICWVAEAWAPTRPGRSATSPRRPTGC